MVDLPLAPPPASTAGIATAVPAAPIPVAVALETLPESLGTLLNALQTTATPIAVSDTSLVLSTIMGNLTVSLIQKLSEAEKQNLTKQLLALVDLEKSLTFTIQPGSPPTQAVLMVPPPASSAQGPRTTPPPPPKPIAAGDQFTAVVLPAAPELSPSAARPTAKSLSTSAPTPRAAPENLAANAPVSPLNQFLPKPSPNPPPSLPSAEPNPASFNFPPAAPHSHQVVLGQTDVANVGISAPPTTWLTQPASAALPQPPTPVSQASADLLEVSAYPIQRLPTPKEFASPAPVTRPASSSAPHASVLTVQELDQATRQPIKFDAPTIPTPSARAEPLAPPPQPQHQPQSHPIATAPLATLSEPQPLVGKLFVPAPSLAPPLQASEVLLKPGNEVSIRIVSVLRPTADAPPSPPPLAPNEVAATVRGTGTEGQLILQSEDKAFFIKAPVSAPPGSTIILAIDEPKPEPLVTLPHARDLNFQALPQALAALEQISPHIFNNVMTNFLPQPSESLGGALMFLLSAFKQGDLSSWLGGSAVETLKTAGKHSLVGSLSKELNAQPSQDPVVGEWRTYPIPLFAHQQFESLTLHVHSDRDARKDKSGKEKAVGKIRFLIDMRLSRLGAMQVDGFVQPKKLDMVLRSENALPEGLHHELRLAYIKALDAVGYTGSLNFQVGRQHWMVMAKETPKGIVT